MEYRETTSHIINIMKYHGISREIMKDHERSCNIINIMKHHAMSWTIVNTSWDMMKNNGTVMEYHDISWNSMEYYGIA